MSRLVAVCRTEDYPFERRQIPLPIDDSLTMVMQFGDSCIGCERAGIKLKEFETFQHKFNRLTKEEIKSALSVNEQEIVHLLNQMVPCVGCRKSVERFFSQLVDSGHLALEPLNISKHRILSIDEEFIRNPKALCTLFSLYSSRMDVMLESIPKSKKNKRCFIHSLDPHKLKSASWLEIWNLLSSDCREEVIVVENDCLMDELEDYLHKHRFCGECKTKVMKAYSILIGEADGSSEKGYCPSLYSNLRVCQAEKHIHVSSQTDYMGQLIGRTEPEIIGGRERHAKTLDVAQEEVLTCIGIYLYDRLNKIWQRLRAKEQTWQILFYLSIYALEKKFEASIEQKRGISNLELACHEMICEEQEREQRQRHRRQRKRNKRKNKSNDCVNIRTNNNYIWDENDNLSSVKSSICDNDYKDLSLVDSYCNCDINTKFACDQILMENSCSNRSDCGYSSGHEGSDNCSIISSPEGSVSGCLDNLCNHSGDSLLCQNSQTLDVSCNCDKSSCSSSPSSPRHLKNTHLNDCQHKNLNAQYSLSESDLYSNLNRSKHKNEKNSLSKLSNSHNSPQKASLSLQELLDASYLSDENETISEEEISSFRANATALNKKRQKLRETLKERFALMTKNGCCVYPECNNGVTRLICKRNTVSLKC